MIAGRCHSRTVAGTGGCHTGTRQRCDAGGNRGFQPEAAAVTVISTALRAKFDPAGILNPGRMSVPTNAMRKAG
ncbi:MAG: hypothetical protein R3D29_04910 [Nitratireductor sp.]